MRIKAELKTETVQLFVCSFLKKIPPYSTAGRNFMNALKFLYFTFSTMALKAWGLFMARSASTLRLISIPALWRAPISCE